jgi:DNA-binding NarL/FixJ family response regulator
MPALLPERRAYERWARESLAVLGDHAYEEARQQGRHLALQQSLREARDFLASSADAAPRPATTAISHTNGLSPRELDVLRLVADGRSDREIADALFIGPGTVRTHLAHTFGKLEVGSRTAAVAAARRHGIL